MKRRKFESVRPSVTAKFAVGGWKGYLIMSFFDNDQPGEVFIRIAKEGTITSGLMDGIAVMASMMLQHGFTWEAIAEKWRHTRFEPLGEDASSLLDCVAQVGAKLISERGGRVDADCWVDEDIDQPLDERKRNATEGL